MCRLPSPAARRFAVRGSDKNEVVRAARADTIDKTAAFMSRHLAAGGGAAAGAEDAAAAAAGPIMPVPGIAVSVPLASD